jgi:hypothetical protein
MAFKHFNNVPITLTLQGTDIVTGWIINASKERAVFAGTYN